ncbi:MAG TPA: DNA/RNA nuclease SfsA, partial [Candidatus Thermoplasmatota archaeon]|nr:DNA/RNA nuclease SfsA [Candidatus Thermoplasmatota archaeon]
HVPLGLPLQPGRLERRYKRFLADVALDALLPDGSAQVTAHCPNPGSMLGLAEAGMRVQLSRSDTPGRKLPWTLELVSPDGGATWVGCNTMRPNGIVARLALDGRVERLDASAGLRREVRYGTASRVDLVLGPEGRPHFVEVKNTTLAKDLPDGGRVALFPDAVTQRGATHMLELAREARRGRQATVVFLVNRGDCDAFGVADAIDPTYARALRKAERDGVRVLPLGMHVQPGGWTLRGELPRV